jgi:hypothetical protein
LTLQGYIWYKPIIIPRVRDFSALLLGRIPRSTHASLKLLKTQWEKYGERVHSVPKYIVHVASLKTIYEKLQENSYMGKRVQRMYSGQFIIFGIMKIRIFGTRE